MGSWKKIGFLSTALLVGAMALPAFGQAAPGDNGAGGGGGAAGGGGGVGGGGGGRGNRGGGGGGGGGFNPQQFQQQRQAALKTSLGVTDDEMAALQPKIDAIQKDQNDLRGGFGFGGRNRGNRGGGGPGGAAADPNAAPAAAPALSPLAQARKDLQDVLNNKDSSADQIKAKLEAFRAAKKAVQDDLAKAQGDLKSLLTQKQEAVFVLNGTLE